MIFANKWYDKSFESIWISKILKQINRNEKIVQRFESLIKITIRFYQTFDVNKNICTLMTNANLCEISKINIIAIDKEIDLQSTRRKCKRWRKWWSKQTIENLFLQDLICDSECKESKIRTFDVSWLNIRTIYFSSFLNFVSKRQIQYWHRQWSKWLVRKR